jgi:hypothetical protein
MPKIRHNKRTEESFAKMGAKEVSALRPKAAEALKKEEARSYGFEDGTDL